MFTYQRTYGLHGSSLSENFHSSAKGGIGSQKISLHDAPKYFRENLSTRNLNVNGKKQLPQSLKHLFKDCSGKGFDRLLALAKCYLTDAGQTILLQQIQASFGYTATKVSLVDCSKLEETSEEEVSWRGASYARFRCILKEAQKNGSGNFYRVVTKSRGSAVDIIYVTDDGSFASTSPWDCQWGMPGRRTLSVFNAGLIGLNMKLHFDAIYHKEYVADLCSDIDVLKANVAPDNANESLVLPTVRASIDWAENSTNEEWNIIVLGGDDTPYQMVRSSRSAVNPDSKAEMLKKVMQDLNTMAKYDESVMLEVVELHGRVGKRREEEARLKLSALKKTVDSDKVELSDNVELVTESIIVKHDAPRTNKRMTAIIFVLRIHSRSVNTVLKQIY